MFERTPEIDSSIATNATLVVAALLDANAT